jgi:hypothetical protein
MSDVLFEHQDGVTVTHSLADFQPQRPRSANVGFMVDKMALGQLFSKYLIFSYQISFHQFVHIHYFSCLQRYIRPILTSSLSNKLNQLYGSEHYSRGHQLCSHSIVSQHFMEFEGSLPHLQEFSNCAYPKPDQSSPHHPILPLQDPS